MDVRNPVSDVLAFAGALVVFPFYALVRYGPRALRRALTSILP